VTQSVETFVRETVEAVRPLDKAWQLAEWESAVNGTPEANQRHQEAQAAWMRFWAERGRFAQAKRLHDARDTKDPLVARQLKLVYLSAARNQQDDATIDELTRLEAEVRSKYVNFRGRVGGKELNDNEIEAILHKGKDSAEVREAWEASKQVGAQVAESVRQLARVRNAAARAQGFRDHFQRSLTLDEIDENELLSLFADLEFATRKPFAVLKDRIDGLRAAHFGIARGDLRPWHYGDRFFQEVPRLGDVDMDGLFAGKDLVALAMATYDGLGLEVRDILARSDLYARPGKDQHAFCIHIDREGDVRTLNNLVPTKRWASTLLHELGHGVYDKYIDPDLPWMLRQPAHTLSTEAIAGLMGSLTSEPSWLSGILGLPKQEVSRLSRAARDHERAVGLIFTRWCLVMTYFELALYTDPERDLDTLWWDLVERYQMVRRPEGRTLPDWAAKYHIAMHPVYYQNYELGHLVAEQFRDRIQRTAGGIVDQKKAGRWLMERVFKPGAREDWGGHVKTATGEPLNSKYFVRSVS
jgi:peptidyl-dipeptidase A